MGRQGGVEEEHATEEDSRQLPKLRPDFCCRNVIRAKQSELRALSHAHPHPRAPHHLRKLVMDTQYCWLQDPAAHNHCLDFVHAILFNACNSWKLAILLLARITSAILRPILTLYRFILPMGCVPIANKQRSSTKTHKTRYPKRPSKEPHARKCSKRPKKYEILCLSHTCEFIHESTRPVQISIHLP